MKDSILSKQSSFVCLPLGDKKNQTVIRLHCQANFRGDQIAEEVQIAASENAEGTQKRGKK